MNYIGYSFKNALEMLVAPRISECFGLTWSAFVCYSLPCRMQRHKNLKLFPDEARKYILLATYKKARNTLSRRTKE